MASCATVSPPYVSAVSGDVPAPAARLVAADLVAALKRTTLIPTTSDLCLAQGAESSFDAAIWRELRNNGYAVTLAPVATGSNATNCLSYRATISPGISTRVQFGAFCLHWKKDSSLCRAYELPKAVATTAMSIRGFELTPAPTLAPAAKASSVCETRNVVHQIQVGPESHSRLRADPNGPKLRALAGRTKPDSASACLLLIAAGTEASIAQAKSIEQKLRLFGAASAQIHRKIDALTPESLVIVQFREGS